MTAHALTFDVACAKLRRALAEFRVRGVHTNVPFIANVLRHPDFVGGKARTDFIEAHPELFQFPPLRDRGNKVALPVVVCFVVGVACQPHCLISVVWCSCFDTWARWR